MFFISTVPSGANHLFGFFSSNTRKPFPAVKNQGFCFLPEKRMHLSVPLVVILVRPLQLYLSASPRPFPLLAGADFRLTCSVFFFFSWVQLLNDF